MYDIYEEIYNEPFCWQERELLYHIPCANNIIFNLYLLHFILEVKYKFLLNFFQCRI